MGKTMSAADKEILAEVVRLTQRKGLQGAVGGWKDFLKCHDGEFGFGFSDPTRRSKELLLAFLQTFKKKEKKAFKKMVRRLCDQNAMVQFMKDLDFESPEQRLVRLTMEHPRYFNHFSFPFFDEKWVVTPLGEVPEAMHTKSMIAVDCEMVLCKDGTEAVVKICAVDHNLEVKINKLVNPGKAVADYRTHITGLSSEDLEGVTCCLADIQKSLKKLLSHGKILVGHGLYNDLHALKVDHLRVIDTSFIFTFAGLPTHSPSLNTLCKVVLGSPVREEGAAHDCLNDAEAAMKLVLAKLEGGYDNPIEIAGHDMPPSVDLARLCLHKIPIEVPTQELQKLFDVEYDAVVESDVRIRGECYSTYAVFKSATEANEAFSKIEGHLRKDSSGRPQKQVLMKYGDGKNARIYIRRMSADVHCNGSDSLKRPVQYENDDLRREQADGTIDAKRQKTCLYPCDHVKEIEKLREALHRREEEIVNLQKALFEFI